VIRACREAGLRSIACYADPDEGAPHKLLADEAHRLPGTTPAETYLNAEALLAIAAAVGADAVHPATASCRRTPFFADAVITAGLILDRARRRPCGRLGDKVSAREVARRVGAPMVAGTDRPVRDAGEVEDFARRHGLPVAIKAALGGGGRGIQDRARTEEIVELFDSAVREASRLRSGECFVSAIWPRPGT